MRAKYNDDDNDTSTFEVPEKYEKIIWRKKRISLMRFSQLFIVSIFNNSNEWVIDDINYYYH